MRIKAIGKAATPRGVRIEITTGDLAEAELVERVLETVQEHGWRGLLGTLRPATVEPGCASFEEAKRAMDKTSDWERGES
jgi:hypothetical protein